MCNSTLSLLPNSSWKTLFGGMNILIAVTATLENLLVMLILLWYTNMHTLSNRILLSLAFSDLLVGLTLAPAHAMQLLCEDFEHDCIVEEVRRYLSTLLIGASAFTLGFISYDRYLHIVKLANYRRFMNKSKALVIILVCWLIPGLIPLLRYIDDSESTYFISIISALVLILGALLCCYTLAIYGLKKQKQRLIKSINSSLEVSQRRASRTVIIIITCFVVMVIPICIHHALLIFVTGFDAKKRAQVYIIGQTLGMLNSSVNPIIYYYRNPTFKENLHKVLRWNFRRGTMRLNRVAYNGSSAPTSLHDMQTSSFAQDSVPSIYYNEHAESMDSKL